MLQKSSYHKFGEIDAWLQNEGTTAIHEKVAQAYNKYQHCGIKGARNFFATGW